MTQDKYKQTLQTQLNWCVEKEYYEMAARLRDIIASEETDDEKQDNPNSLLEKYSPIFYEVLELKYTKEV